MNEDYDILEPDDQLVYSDEDDCLPHGDGFEENWKIIIADDEQEIHTITKMVLSNYEFENKGLEFISAYSGAEAKKLIQDHPDTAVILLDVVMESDESGLEVVKHIRETISNSFVRIILRTGQPGKAPEKEVIMTFDINDYKEKTELTAQKLFTTLTTALRSYRDLKTIDKNRKGLEQIIFATPELFEQQSLKKFISGVLTQLLSILKLDETSLYLQTAGFAAAREKDQFVVLAATGKYENCVDKTIAEVVPENVQNYLNTAMSRKEGLFIDDTYIGYFCTKNGSENFLYVNGCKSLTPLDKKLISIFASNVAIAFDNIHLNKDIVENQNEVIFTLGELIDNRLQNSSNHVRRMAEYCKLLALKYGLDADEAELLRISAPMHDIGKIGIIDALLHKTGRYSTDEFNEMKSHAEIGFEILKSSKRKIMRTAAIIAQNHHERWDGEGYPLGLKGEEIHIYGRIACVADVFDALLHTSSYKEAWELEKVLSLFKIEKGKHFDPQLVDVLIENIDEMMKINGKFPDNKQIL